MPYGAVAKRFKKRVATAPILYPKKIKSTEKAHEQQAPQYTDIQKSSMVVRADPVTKIDVIRTVFLGMLVKGKIAVGDVLNVTDGTGRILCNEGVVMKIIMDKRSVSEVKEQQQIDEILVAVEIPKGTYNGLFLIDGKLTLKSKTEDEKTEASNNLPKEENKKDNNEKSGLFSLFKHKLKK